jgi:hypothetical protein
MLADYATETQPDRRDYCPDIENPFELIRDIVNIVFREPPRIPRIRALFQTDKLEPAWCRYLQPRPSPIWKKFTPKGSQRARDDIDAYFVPLQTRPCMISISYLPGLRRPLSLLLGELDAGWPRLSAWRPFMAAVSWFPSSLIITNRYSVA